MIVLDEVLNHLDGPGRARVGRVLRAMCQRPASHRNCGGDNGGGHEEYGGISTAIVILQDLAAGELEVRRGKGSEAGREEDSIGSRRRERWDLPVLNSDSSNPAIKPTLAITSS